MKMIWKLILKVKTRFFYLTHVNFGVAVADNFSMSSERTKRSTDALTVIDEIRFCLPRLVSTSTRLSSIMVKLIIKQFDKPNMDSQFDWPESVHNEDLKLGDYDLRKKRNVHWWKNYETTSWKKTKEIIYGLRCWQYRAKHLFHFKRNWNWNWNRLKAKTKATNHLTILMNVWKKLASD